jgi:hypothetical protein
VIEDIRRLMLRSANTTSNEKLCRKEGVAAAAAQKQPQGNGADEQLQRMIWDLGGFPQLIWKAHEKELMNFAAEEFDAGASLHIIQPAMSSACIQDEERCNLI